MRAAGRVLLRGWVLPPRSCGNPARDDSTAGLVPAGRGLLGRVGEAPVATWDLEEAAVAEALSREAAGCLLVEICAAWTTGPLGTSLSSVAALSQRPQGSRCTPLGLTPLPPAAHLHDMEGLTSMSSPTSCEETEAQGSSVQSPAPPEERC